MKRNNIIIIAILIALALWGVSMYNGLVSNQEKVNAQWSNVENQYQRRADLIPNIVSTVKGYAKHEAETFEKVVEARSKASQTSINANDLNAEKLAEFQAKQNDISSALNRLMVVVERYPELKANQNFLELQAQLEGCENRIAVERRNFNTLATEYNTKIRRFPTNLFAGIFGFGEKPYFAAEEGSEKAPKVQF